MNFELGTLFGLGVGPGDPGLVTVRAVEVLQKAATIAFPVHRKGAASRALAVVASYLPETATRLPLVLPMTRDRDRLRQSRNEAAGLLARAGEDGDVACLSLGDPLFYSTFGYLAGKYPGRVEVISGVTAMSAMAAGIGLPLAEGDTPTVVVTGADSDGLAAALKIRASIVIIKPRALPPASLDLMDAHGVWSRAVAAVELGSPAEKIIQRLNRDSARQLPYFAVLWIKAAGEPEDGQQKDKKY